MIECVCVSEWLIQVWNENKNMKLDEKMKNGVEVWLNKSGGYVCVYVSRVEYILSHKNFVKQSKEKNVKITFVHLYSKIK